jgi:aspartate dehydrogenase
MLGFGRIGQALYEFIADDPEFELEYAYVRSEKEALPADKHLTDVSRLSEIDVDLCVEAATHEVAGELGESVLQANDMLVLSGSALIDPETEERLISTAEANGTDIYLPHGALFGVDGLVDARDTLEEVSMVATKAPGHLDYSFTDEYEEADVTERTVLYEGSVRGLCEHFPRNFNSHAVIALASLGLDETQSKLVADPDAEGAHHVISASGEGYDLEVVRDSAIEGVTGDYTLVSTWGSMRRILEAVDSPKFV